MPSRSKRNITMLLVTLALAAVTGMAQAETRFAVQSPDGTNDVMTVTQEGKIGIGLGPNEDPFDAIHVRGAADTTAGALWQTASILAEGDAGGGLLGYNKQMPKSMDIRLGYTVFGAFNYAQTMQYHAAGMMGFSEAGWNWDTTQGALSTPAYLSFYTTQVGSASKAERVRIGGNGNVAIGTADTSTYKLNVAGSISAVSGPWASSDMRLKKNVQPISESLGKVLKLTGHTYEWNSAEHKEKTFPEGRHYGVIAQEIEKVLPEVVNTGSDGYKAVAYTEIIPVLIEAIKEQQKQIEELKKKLSDLKP